jgi:nitroreductase
MLGATERGLGGCMIGSIEREALRELLEIPQKFKPLLLLALGKPVEKVVLEAADRQYIADQRMSKRTDST